MKIVVFIVSLLAALNCSAILGGIYTEYKRTLINGDKGKDYTFDGKAFVPSLQYNFGDAGNLKIKDADIESENVYTIINNLLIIKRLIKTKTRIDTLIYKFEIEEKKEELILSEYRDGYDDGYYLKKHYFKKGSHTLPANNKSDLDIYTIVDQMPEFPGGVVEMNMFIAKNQDAPGNGDGAQRIEKVYVKLLIAPSGKIKDARILVYPKIKFARAAMQLVKKLPNFSPGKQDGKAVYVYYTLPMTFRN